MADKNRRKVVIPKENAVFRMDENGNWCNEHGRFEHPRIIKYFNASIRKDENGYFVYQATDEFEEKVYFPYEDTALFIVDIREDNGVKLVLNTTQVIDMEPEGLYSKNDNLYLKTKEHRIKFSSRALLKLSKYLNDKDGALFFESNGQSWRIG